jgi:hypothetical protein
MRNGYVKKSQYVNSAIFNCILVIKLPSFLTFLCHNFLSCSTVDKLLYFLGTLANCEKRLLASSCLSVRMEQLGSHWTDFHEIWYLWIFRKSVEKIQDSLKSDKNKGYFTWRPKSLFIIPRSFLLRMRNVSDKSCRENQNTHVVFSNFLENRTIYEKMWKIL